MHRRRRSDRDGGGAGLILPIDPAVHQQLERAIERCGIPVADVTITYEDYLQSEQILVRSTSLSDDQLRCLSAIEREAPSPIVMFESIDLTRRNSELQQQQARADAREWFRQRGLLDRLPVFEPGKEEPMQFARRIEEFCGIKPGAALEMNDELHVITPRIEWIGKALTKGSAWRKVHGARHDRQFQCLMKAMSAADAAEHGIRFGFIGNAYVAPETQP